jgi:hypothetical protein
MPSMACGLGGSDEPVRHGFAGRSRRARDLDFVLFFDNSCAKPYRASPRSASGATVPEGLDGM